MKAIIGDSNSTLGKSKQSLLTRGWHFTSSPVAVSRWTRRKKDFSQNGFVALVLDNLQKSVQDTRVPVSLWSYHKIPI
jgi:hypothetical protein